MRFFERFLSWVMGHSGHLLFLLIWTIITVAAAISMAYAVRRLSRRTSEPAADHQTALDRVWPRTGSPGTAVVLILLAGVLVSYVAMSLVWEDFAYYDDSQLTLLTLEGHNFWMQIDPTSGRFWPFGLQEFNVIRHFTKTASGYHALPILEILAFCCIFLVLDDEISITARVLLAITALLTPSIVFSFNSLVFIERNVLFLLAGLVLCVKRFEQTLSIIWALAAILCAQIMLYSKETAFLLILGFSVSRLILQCGAETSAGWKITKLWSKQSSLDFCLTALAAVFLIYYFTLVGIHGKMTYADASRLPRAQAVLAYLKVDLLPWLFFVVVLTRSCLILCRRLTPSLLWDSLAFAGVTWYLGYLYLGLFSIYYTGPVDLIAILYVGRLAVLSWSRSWQLGKTLMLLLAFIILFQNLVVSAFVLFERKNVIHAKAQIASALKAQYRYDSANDMRLFFPFAGGYVIMEFAAYLNYRGVPVPGADFSGPVKGPPEGAAGVKRVYLIEARRTRASHKILGSPPAGGPCFPSRGFWCQAVREPGPGDLVIVLPDDEASLAQAAIYRKRGQLLLSYEPWPRLPHWLYLLFNWLPVGPESRYRDYPLPDRWMDASVTKW